MPSHCAPRLLTKSPKLRAESVRVDQREDVETSVSFVENWCWRATLSKKMKTPNDTSVEGPLTPAHKLLGKVASV